VPLAFRDVAQTEAVAEPLYSDRHHPEPVPVVERPMEELQLRLRGRQAEARQSSAEVLDAGVVQRDTSRPLILSTHETNIPKAAESANQHEAGAKNVTLTVMVRNCQSQPDETQ
jgi:hypothetical protein